MSVKDEATIEKIQQLSLSLNTAQLEQFVTIIESLADLLQVANKDTEKAYRMYLNSIQSTQEDAYIDAQIIPVYQGAASVTPLKH